MATGAGVEGGAAPAPAHPERRPLRPSQMPATASGGARTEEAATAAPRVLLDGDEAGGAAARLAASERGSWRFRHRRRRSPRPSQMPATASGGARPEEAAAAERRRRGASVPSRGPAVSARPMAHHAAVRHSPRPELRVCASPRRAAPWRLPSHSSRGRWSARRPCRSVGDGHGRFSTTRPSPTARRLSSHLNRTLHCRKARAAFSTCREAGLGGASQTGCAGSSSPATGPPISSLLTVRPSTARPAPRRLL